MRRLGGEKNLKKEEDKLDKELEFGTATVGALGSCLDRNCDFECESDNIQDIRMASKLHCINTGHIVHVECVYLLEVRPKTKARNNGARRRRR